MIALLLLAGEAFARAGGGGGFSTGDGGGGGGGFGGGGGGGEVDVLIRLVVWLVFDVPVIGVPLLILLVIGFIWFQLQNPAGSAPPGRFVARTAPRPVAPSQVEELLRVDPGFSEVLFLDWARLVYARAHEERGRKNLGALEAVLAPPVIERLGARAGQPVRDVIFGSVRLRAVRLVGDEARAEVRFIANYTEGATVRYAEEVWTFSRAASVRSPGPEGMQALRCPNCGSALETRTDGSCVSCGTPLATNRQLWRVVDVAVSVLREVPNLTLTLGGGTEAGTDLPLVRPPDFAASQRALAARHPEFDPVAFNKRVIEVFERVQQSWSDMEPEAVRALETDGLFQAHRYWIERYRREGLRNRMTGVRVTGVLPARIQMDAYFTTLTLRIFATCFDWTENAAGKVVGGSKTEARRFSEYWTFVRTAGKPLTPRADLATCPSCGAPLDRVGEGGVCGYCDAKITSGDFDWVLAAIDQDDVYGM